MTWKNLDETESLGFSPKLENHEGDRRKDYQTSSNILSFGLSVSFLKLNADAYQLCLVNACNELIWIILNVFASPAGVFAKVFSPTF